MSSTTHTFRQAQGRLVAAHRWGDPEQIAKAQTEVATERIAIHAAKVMADSPPLTAEQRERITDLLRGGGQ